jgi:ABC-type nitrate/sulfonate/bicarbonate transport system permease component
MILLPGIVPDMITGSRVGMGFAWRAVVAAEMIGLTQGVGSLLIEAKNTAQTDVVIVSMATLGVLMVIFEKVIFESLERRIDRWKGAQAE